MGSGLAADRVMVVANCLAHEADGKGSNNHYLGGHCLIGYAVIDSSLDITYLRLFDDQRVYT